MTCAFRRSVGDFDIRVGAHDHCDHDGGGVPFVFRRGAGDLGGHDDVGVLRGHGGRSVLYACHDPSFLSCGCRHSCIVLGQDSRKVFWPESG